jgi:uncharacterized membrane protein YidH (DUF202 family)
MKMTKIIGIMVLAFGVLALAYGSFTFTTENHQTRLGSLTLSFKEKETVYIPIWGGVAAIIVGGGMLLYPFAKKAK